MRRQETWVLSGICHSLCVLVGIKSSLAASVSPPISFFPPRPCPLWSCPRQNRRVYSSSPSVGILLSLSLTGHLSSCPRAVQNPHRIHAPPPTPAPVWTLLRLPRSTSGSPPWPLCFWPHLDLLGTSQKRRASANTELRHKPPLLKTPVTPQPMQGEATTPHCGPSSQIPLGRSLPGILPPCPPPHPPA